MYYCTWGGRAATDPAAAAKIQRQLCDALSVTAATHPSSIRAARPSASIPSFHGWFILAGVICGRKNLRTSLEL